MDWLENAVSRQLDSIAATLSRPLQELATICAPVWNNQVHLDHALSSYLDNKSNHRCRTLYTIDPDGRQTSSSISANQADDALIGQDLSNRPYLDLASGAENFGLTKVYMDKRTRKPCITALHRVTLEGRTQGYIAADFGLKDLPLREVEKTELDHWRQIKGDPSIRGTLFQQTRTESAMDKELDTVLSVIESLVCEQGIFHAKLHFSSSRATLWPYSDPYRYRLHVLDEILDPRVCLVYAKTQYPEDAIIPAEQVQPILAVFKALREADETIYLRAASLNIMNGLVGLNFSCDGSHYMPADEFLGKDISFWFGSQLASCAVI